MAWLRLLPNVTFLLHSSFAKSCLFKLKSVHKMNLLGKLLNNVTFVSTNKASETGKTFSC